MAQRLTILDEFSQNLKDNLARVELNEARVLQGEKKLDDFQNDDVFQHAWQNYTVVYQEIMEQRRWQKIDFRAEMDELAAELSQRAPLKQFRDLERRSGGLEDQARHSGDRIGKLEALQKKLELRVDELKVQAPPKRGGGCSLRPPGAERTSTRESVKPAVRSSGGRPSSRAKEQPPEETKPADLPKIDEQVPAEPK